MKDTVKVDHLSYSYKKNNVFDLLDIEFKNGKISTIIGPNKCGKTTLIKLIAGILPSKNNISISDNYLNKKTGRTWINQFGIVFEQPSKQFLFSKVEQELVFPLENLACNKEEILERIESIAKVFKIKSLFPKNPKDLSIKEQQKVLLAIALLGNPKVLLLDNALSMMNKSEKKEIYEYLKKIQQQTGLTIIITTNDMEETLYSDYVYVMEQGKIVSEGTPLEVLSQDQKLIHLGLSLPFMVDLSLKLKFYEVMTEIMLDMNGMVNWLWKS